MYTVRYDILSMSFTLVKILIYDIYTHINGEISQASAVPSSTLSYAPNPKSSVLSSNHPHQIPPDSQERTKISNSNDHLQYTST